MAIENISGLSFHSRSNNFFLDWPSASEFSTPGMCAAVIHTLFSMHHSQISLTRSFLFSDFVVPIGFGRLVPRRDESFWFWFALMSANVPFIAVMVRATCPTLSVSVFIISSRVLLAEFFSSSPSLSLRVSSSVPIIFFHSSVDRCELSEGPRAIEFSRFTRISHVTPKRLRPMTK